MVPDICKRSSLFSPAREDWLDRLFFGWPTMSIENDRWTPRTDIQETEREIFINSELPGMKKEDVKVEVKDNVLTVSGERKSPGDEGHTYRSIERFYGKFERSFVLPDDIATDTIKTNFKDGILTIALQKTAKAVPKEIAVEVE
jgi:HSP20 family protein